MYENSRRLKTKAKWLGKNTCACGLLSRSVTIKNHGLHFGILMKKSKPVTGLLWENFRNPFWFCTIFPARQIRSLRPGPCNVCCIWEQTLQLRSSPRTWFNSTRGQVKNASSQASHGWN